MHFVTLTTDWFKDDFYTGAMTGKLLSSCEDVRIHNLSNRIKAFSIYEAAFVVRNSYHHFPEGTVHLIMVGSDYTPGNQILAARIDGHYFITADNGLLGLIGDGKIEELIGISPDENSIHSFPGLSIFAETAGKILNGIALSEIGKPCDDYMKQVPLRATLENDTITGTVIYLDSFGNAFTNISKELFERIGKDRQFEIYVQSKHYRINKINRWYSETDPGDLLALFNSVNLLEIAIRNGSAKDLLNLNTDSTIRIGFK